MLSDHTDDDCWLDKSSSSPAEMREHTEKKTDRDWREEPTDDNIAITEVTLLKTKKLGSKIIWINVPGVSNTLEGYQQVV